MNTTNTMASQRPILVGVDGSDRSLAAVRWAAAEAADLAVPLHLLCVIDDYSILSPELRARSVTPAATAALEQAREVACETRPSLRVEAEATSGVPAARLAEKAEGCRMLVLGRHGAGAFRELLLGSTTTRAAAHAESTVVVVPDAWSPSRSGPVVVGLAEDGAGPALEQALVEGQRRGVAVRAVHAWDIHPELSWDAELAYGDLHEFEGGVRSRLMQVVTPWTTKFPDVAFELEVRRAHPANALKEASAGAVLMVVGAHHRRFHRSNGHQRLGSVARAVLHHAAVPVMVVRGN